MEPMMAEIILFAGNYAPRGWAFCNGQILAIAQNQALYSLLGTTYGGDGRTSFALPDLRGRAPIHPGLGPGLTLKRLGQSLGSELNQLNVTQLPNHNHDATAKVNVSSKDADQESPVGNYLAPHSGRDSAGEVQVNAFSNTTDAEGGKNMVEVTVGNTGGNQPINNMQPSLGINYIISMVGEYPPRS